MESSVSPELERLLRCPVSGLKLRMANFDELIRFKAELPEGAWITEDNSRAYPIRNGFPILVPDEALKAEEKSSN